MRRVLESFCAECAVLAASRGARSIFIVGILFYSLLYPSPYFYEVPQDLPFFAVDQDGSTSSRQLLRSLDATEGIRLHRYADLGQAFADLRSGAMMGGIVIPRDFERGLLRGQETAVPYYSEAAHLLSYGMLVQGGRLATENLGAGARVERLRKQGVPESAALALQVRGRIDARLLYNPAGNYASNTVPPVFVLILQQIMIIGCAMLAVTRKRFPGTAGGMAAAAGRLLLSLCLGLIFALLSVRAATSGRPAACPGFCRAAVLPAALFQRVPFSGRHAGGIFQQGACGPPAHAPYVHPLPFPERHHLAVAGHAFAPCLSGPVRACHTCHLRLYADGFSRGDAGRCPAFLGPAAPAQCRRPGGPAGTASAQGWSSRRTWAHIRSAMMAAVRGCPA